MNILYFMISFLSIGKYNQCYYKYQQLKTGFGLIYVFLHQILLLFLF